jgi:hypothetical protein
MLITDNKKLRDIQLEFNQKFTHLRIEFYSQHHERGEGSSVIHKLSDQQTIGEVRSRHVEDELNIDADMSVEELENLFEEKFGLNVQVFRKSGAMWMQTTSTDQWTLREQNRKGGASEEAFIEKYGS